MKKAVISTGGKQYLVSEGETLSIEVIKVAKSDKPVELKPLLVIEDGKINLGKPVLENQKVKIEIIEPVIKADKVTAVRYKAKKRVHKVHGHRQQQTVIKITEIS